MSLTRASKVRLMLADALHGIATTAGLPLPMRSMVHAFMPIARKHIDALTEAQIDSFLDFVRPLVEQIDALPREGTEAESNVVPLRRGG